MLRVATTQSTWPVAVRHAVVASKIIEAFIQVRRNLIETRQVCHALFMNSMHDIEA